MIPLLTFTTLPGQTATVINHPYVRGMISRFYFQNRGLIQSEFLFSRNDTSAFLPLLDEEVYPKAVNADAHVVMLSTYYGYLSNISLSRKYVHTRLLISL